jgi:hypothetical protein
MDILEESGRFLKKAAQKLLIPLGHGRCQRQRPWPSINKVFLLLFVHKKKSSMKMPGKQHGRS